MYRVGLETRRRGRDPILYNSRVVNDARVGSVGLELSEKRQALVMYGAQGLDTVAVVPAL
jgi:hypothetical protein